MASNLPSPIDPSFLPKLDPDFIEYYNAYLAIKTSAHTVSIEDMRAFPQKYAAPWARNFTFEPFVKDIKIKSDDGHVFTARCYHPDPRTSPFGEGPYPVHINFHGGGFVLGGLEGDAEICMLVRDRVGILVVDVDYRMAPEHAFVHEHGQEINARPDSISIGGISAGGHISAVMQQLARDASLNLRLAALSVPATTWRVDMTKPSDSPYQSFQENELAPCLNWKRMQFFGSLSAPKNDAQKAELESRPRFITTPVEGDLRGVCDTFMATAECDPVRDEGVHYAQRLMEAGVKVTYRQYTGVPHPFMHMAIIKKAQLYMDDLCAELRRAHNA
ncbi:hypothetical protein MPDQ_002126 [Monascus purpureus]|uniref:Alpha/beta hydrolase fold-3 domain-containing protein n=1 Tax=Monascus purpureus TaxID=5098 RepID=A0A507QQJ6_MONPU|nr:hypothetical protein MPDQ_002126 [Monascus purpureus]